MKAAELIWNSWESGNKIKSIPSKLAPQNRLEAYKIQENLEALSKSEILGWKIAATSLDGQKHIGVNGPLAGRILSNKTFKPGASVALSHNKMAVAEPEFAFKISLTLEPKNKLYIPEEVIDFIEDLHLAIELPDSRFEDFSKVGELGLIADNACAHQFVISSPIKFEWQNIDLSLHRVRIYNNKNLSHDGVGSNVLGGPLIALTWLINEMSQNNITIQKGMIISTGTCALPLPIACGDKITADFGVLGFIDINIE